MFTTTRHDVARADWAKGVTTGELSFPSHTFDFMTFVFVLRVGARAPGVNSWLVVTATAVVKSRLKIRRGFFCVYWQKNKKEPQATWWFLRTASCSVVTSRRWPPGSSVVWGCCDDASLFALMRNHDILMSRYRENFVVSDQQCDWWSEALIQWAGQRWSEINQRLLRHTCDWAAAACVRARERFIKIFILAFKLSGDFSASSFS